MEKTCGAQFWTTLGGKIFVLGTCQLKQGHREEVHQEWRNGELWEAWEGPVEFAPTEIPSAEDSLLTTVRELVRAWRALRNNSETHPLPELEPIIQVIEAALEKIDACHALPQ